MKIFTTCLNCLSTSSHFTDTKVNFCFFCGFKILPTKREKKAIEINESPNKPNWASNLKPGGTETTDWDLEFTKEFRKKNEE